MDTSKGASCRKSAVNSWPTGATRTASATAPRSPRKPKPRRISKRCVKRQTPSSVGHSCASHGGVPASASQKPQHHGCTQSHHRRDRQRESQQAHHRIGHQNHEPLAEQSAEHACQLQQSGEALPLLVRGHPGRAKRHRPDRRPRRPAQAPQRRSHRRRARAPAGRGQSAHALLSVAVR